MRPGSGPTGNSALISPSSNRRSYIAVVIASPWMRRAGTVAFTVAIAAAERSVCIVWGFRRSEVAVADSRQPWFAQPLATAMRSLRIWREGPAVGGEGAMKIRGLAAVAAGWALANLAITGAALAAPPAELRPAHIGGAGLNVMDLEAQKAWYMAKL